MDGHAVVTMQVEQRVRAADPRGRDRAAAPADRPPGHDDRDRPGHERRRAGRRGRDDPARPDRAERQPDQILASLDGDTRAYLQLLLPGGAEGLGGRGKQLSADAPPVRAARARPRQDRQRARRAAPQHLPRRSPASRARRRARRAPTPARRVRHLPERGARRVRRTRRRRSARRCRSCPARCAETRARAGESARSSRTSLGPGADALIPAAQALAPALRSARPFFAETDRPDPRPDPPVHRAVQRPVRHLKQAAKPLAQTTAGAEPVLPELNKLVQRARLQPARRRRGLPLLALLAQPQHERMFLTPGRPRAAAARRDPADLPDGAHRRELRLQPPVHPHPAADHQRHPRDDHLPAGRHDPAPDPRRAADLRP